jgi:hypothetical protein
MVSAERVMQFQELAQEKELRTPYDREIGLAEEV